MKKRDWLKSIPIAHRGIKNKNIIENTVESVNCAVLEGYAVEIDVRITDLNEIIVLHDKNIYRISGINKHYSKLTSKDLKEIKLKGSNSTIPTLQDILNLVNGRVPILIELKADFSCYRLERMSKKVSEILSNYKGEYAIQSFHPEVYRKYKKYDRNTRVGLITPIFYPKTSILNNIFFKYSITRYNYDFITFSVDHLPNNIIKRLSELNKTLLFYHITNKQKEEKAREYNGNIIWADYENIGYKPKKRF